MKIGCVLRAGEGGPLFLLGVFGDETDYVSSVFNYVREMCPGKSFTLASFEVDDWGRDFSPWKAMGCIPGEYFDGGGESTLEWLSGTVNSDFNGGREYDGVFICGYSLAGLFALWCLYVSPVFDGCACCSGSLWFEGWSEFAESHVLLKKCLVYLSLGGKEEQSKNAVMAGIGHATRSQDKLLEGDDKVIAHTLVMNPGGHFASTDKRVAKGIAWLLEQSAKM